ncbi:replication-relaxation family protein [Sporosarcina sp. ITBMC105]
MKKQLSDREERILLLLKKFDFMTRDQLNRYFQFGTVRNTNRILSGLSGYLKSTRIGYETIYYLSKAGKSYVDCEKVRKADGQIRHSIMRNDLWLFNDCPLEWKNETRVSDGYTSVIVDAMYTDGWDRRHFLEVDHKQTMKENRNKIKRFKELHVNGLLEEKFGHFPTIVWLTTTELRRTQMKEYCAGLPAVMVFTTNDIK